MRQFPVVLLMVLLLVFFLGPPHLVPTSSSAQTPLAACAECAYSTEEDFLSQGPVPPDGNPIISDGDLLSCNGTVCMRNAQLLQQFDISQDMDLGLDAVDVLDVKQELVAFSTELNSPHGNFRHGDLLTTWGAVIPNQSLLILFQVTGDRGLDGLQFVGKLESILAFNEFAASVARSTWLDDPGKLVNELRRYEIDIWFSIEGTERIASAIPILDGDILSAANGSIVVGNSALLPPDVPAGIPNRGVDFGADGITAARSGRRETIRFSTEILYRGERSFTDGDVLKYANGIVVPARDLYAPFEPKADFLGTDALHMRIPEPVLWDMFPPLILKMFQAH